MFQYSLGRKSSSVSNSAKFIQFPLRLCFSTTSNKFQGQTVNKPNKIVVDLRSVFIAAMAYVILSRVQELCQLFILGCVPRNKIYADQDALLELERLNAISMNSNPSVWERNSETYLKIFSLNCQSLKPKLGHIRSDQLALKADILCCSETWLISDTLENDLEIQPYKAHLNSFGKGKGLATYYEENKFHISESVKAEKFQLTKLTSNHLDVINVYLSNKVNSSLVVQSFVKLIDFQKTTILCGDFNICYKQEKNDKTVLALEYLGFKQLVTQSTHIQGGHIDHVYLRQSKPEVEIDVSVYSPYYSAKDHDALLISVKFC